MNEHERADKYVNVAEKYLYERKWMAYRAIAATQIRLATPYPRTLISFNEDSPIVQNPGYVEESTYGSEDYFQESMKGCPAFDKLKACLGFWPQR